MRSTWRAAAAAVLMFMVGTTARAQLQPQEINSSGILGPSIMERLTRALANKSAVGDKEHPLVVELADGYGTLYEFTRGDIPVLLFVGTKTIDLGAGVVAPSNALVMNSFVAAVAKREVTLATSDVPAAAQAAVRKLWPSGSTTLRASALVLRAEPSGDVLELLRGFLGLSSFSGTTVLEYQKSTAAITTGLIAYGTLERPFGMDFTLTDPQFFFTRKANKPDPTVGLASTIVVRGHAYDFMAEASNPKLPDIFILRTASMSVQDVGDLVRAVSQPLFGVAPAVDLGWNTGLEPTVSLQPVTGIRSSEFGIVDREKVVIYVARSKPASSEWTLEKYPGVTIRGDLRIDALQQRLGGVSLEADRSGFEETVDLGAKLPGSDLAFGSVRETIRVGKSSFVRIEAESPDKCFQQRLSFSVDAKGQLKASANLGETAQSLEPTAFYGNLKGCASLTAETAKWALATGTKLLGYAQDKAFDAATQVVGSHAAGALASAARDLGIPTWNVGNSLGKILKPDALLDVGNQVYGKVSLGTIARGAGLAVGDVAGWAKRNDWSPEDAGALLNSARFGATSVMDVTARLYPGDQMARLARGAGYLGSQLGYWMKSHGYSATAAGDVLRGGSADAVDWAMAAAEQYDEQLVTIANRAGLSNEAIMRYLQQNRRQLDQIAVLFGQYAKLPSTGVFDAARTVYHLSNEAIAELGLKGTYSATAASQWLKQKGVTAEREMAKILCSGGYDRDQVVSALKSGFNSSTSAAEEWYDWGRRNALHIGNWLPKL